MKKFIIIALVLTGLSAFTRSSYAEVEELGKLKRGFINIVTAPLEIPKQLYVWAQKSKESTFKKCCWPLAGLVNGVSNTVGRLGSGVWDVITFNIENPKKFQPVMKPDYVFSPDQPPPHEPTAEEIIESTQKTSEATTAPTNP